MKTILTILILTSSLFANCEYYNDMFNKTKDTYYAMITANAPYDIVIQEKRMMVYYLENAKALCSNKEYYEILIKFYEEK